MTWRPLLGACLLVLSGGADAQKTALIGRLEALAAKDNAQALYHLGMSYQTSSGVTLDHQKALAYFRRAAALGDPLAAYKMGCFYSGQDDVLPFDEDAALTNKLIAAKAGYALAQQDVAAIYARRGDAQTAGEWIRRAARQGTRDALFGFASMHNGQNGLPRDGAIVVAYFTMFLQRGQPDPDQVKWLAEQREALSASERRRADQIVAAYRPEPTRLTLSALSGQRAAETLVMTAK